MSDVACRIKAFASMTFPVARSIRDTSTRSMPSARSSAASSNFAIAARKGAWKVRNRAGGESRLAWPCNPFQMLNTTATSRFHVESKRRGFAASSLKRCMLPAACWEYCVTASIYTRSAVVSLVAAAGRAVTAALWGFAPPHPLSNRTAKTKATHVRMTHLLTLCLQYRTPSAPVRP